jgi:excisionase family DNA binding protein
MNLDTPPIHKTNYAGKLLSATELAEALRVSEKLVRRYTQRRLIPHYKIGRRWVYDFEAVKETFFMKTGGRKKPFGLKATLPADSLN